MTQLVEQLLPIPEVLGSNPVIGNILYSPFSVNCIEKPKIKKKRPGMAQKTRDQLLRWDERLVLIKLIVVAYWHNPNGP